MPSEALAEEGTIGPLAQSAERPALNRQVRDRDPGGPPIFRPRTPIGRGTALRARSVGVQVAPRTPNFRPATLLVWRSACRADERGSKPRQGAIRVKVVPEEHLPRTQEDGGRNLAPRPNSRP